MSVHVTTAVNDKSNRARVRCVEEGRWSWWIPELKTRGTQTARDPAVVGPSRGSQ